MPLASAYHRPQSIEEAVALLTAENRVALAGGTIVNADREHVGIEVVDLQSLELSGINPADERITIGAMTTLSTMASSEQIEDGLRQNRRLRTPLDATDPSHGRRDGSRRRHRLGR